MRHRHENTLSSSFNADAGVLSWRRLRCGLLLAALAASAPAFALAPGQNGGPITIPVTGSADIVQGAVVDPGGSLVLAGSAASGSDFALARLLPNGSLDTGFGLDGVAAYNLSNSSESLRAVARLGDGRYVGCGVFFSSGTATDFLVARFNANGSLDTTFNGAGYAVVAFAQTGVGATLFDQCNAIAVQADGKIVSAGFTDENGPDHVALVRHTAGGTLDTGFGSGGRLDLNASAAVNGDSQARALAVQPDGKLLVAGYAHGGSNSDFLLLRLEVDGTLDAGFGDGGIVRTPVGAGEDIAYAIALQPDGRIVLAGSTQTAANHRDFALVRYTAGGALDPTFGSGGIATTPVGPGDDIAYALALMPWGRLVAAGSARISTSASGTDLALVAYNADGSLDRYFGDGGKRMVDVSTDSTSDDIVYGLAADLVGARLWAVGTAAPGPSQDFLAVEFGLPDTIFRDGFETPAP